MEKQNWDKIKKLFNRALDQHEENRKEWLKDECGENRELFDIVIKLLNARQYSSPIDKPLDKLPEALFTPESEDNLHREVGKYKLIDVIGHGGMGVVYLAERKDGEFEQKVALKFLRFGMASRKLIRRFKKERQILAKLKHPNIARLYDGGVMKDGTPWFSMEYIEGLPVTEYAEKNNLSIKERLHLFRKICTAVQFAHQNLVIHRDLKPSNIMVTNDGEPMLLDFGLARMEEEKSLKQQEITQSSQNWMTLEYASPEQIRGEKLTTATDIYQLGLVLHELLTGHRPYSVKGSTPSEAEKIICNTQPAKPSTRAKTLDNTQIAASPAELHRMLKGDLDTIILKALEKAPDMRYSSVERMSDDIYRHLSGQPILACKATLRYRMGKFFKRHRRIVVAVCMLVVGLFALNTYHTSQLFEERDIASREAFKAEQINDFMIGLFELANPNLNQGEMLRADEMLEQGINEITSLDSQPEAQIEILYLASEIFRILEQSDKQSSTLHQALDISLQHYGEEHEVTANILNSLGTAYLNLRSFDDSEDYYLRAYDLRKKLLGDNHPSTICSYHNLGLIELNRDNYEKAEYHFRKASEHQNTGCHGIALYNLGQAHYHMGDYHSANKYYTEALEVRLAKYGENHISIAQTLNRLGNNARYLQAYDDALNYYDKSINIKVNLLGEKHDGVARTLESKANVYLFLEEYYKAKELYSDAKKIYISNNGEKSIDNARITSNLAIAKLETGNYEEAVSLQEESAILFKDILGNNHIFTAHILTNLGVALNRKGDYGEAVNVLSNSLSTRKDRLPENHWQIGQTMSLLGYSLHHIGETERSKNKLITGYQTILEQQGTGNRFTIEAFERLEKVYPELALEML